MCGIMDTGSGVYPVNEHTQRLNSGGVMTIGKKIIALSLTAILLAVTTGCGRSDVVSVQADRDRMTDFRRGQTLEIELEANATTGYIWELADPANKDVLRQIGKYRYIHKSRLIGAGGIQIYRFEGLRKGQTKLVFEYRRPWEKGREPAEKRVIRVIIH